MMFLTIQSIYQFLHIKNTNEIKMLNNNNILFYVKLTYYFTYLMYFYGHIYPLSWRGWTGEHLGPRWKHCSQYLKRLYFLLLRLHFLKLK